MLSNLKNLCKLVKCSNNKLIRNYSNKLDLGAYDIRRLTPAFYEPTWNIMNEVFFREDKYCQIIGLDKSVEARNELRFFYDFIVKDDAAYIALEKDKKKVVSICLGKLWTANEMEHMRQTLKTLNYFPSKQFIEQFTDENTDMINYFRVDCIFEGMIAATLPECRGKGLSNKMIIMLADLAKEMSKGKGNNVKIPKVYFGADTVVTDHISKKILGHEVVVQKDVVINGEKKNMKWIINYEYLTNAKL